MKRNFEVGDRIICMTTGVVGQCLEFYTPTGCEEQTMVLTDDGRRYHAPTKEWEVTAKVNPRGYEGEESVNNEYLNPYGEYVVAFAENHGTPVSDVYEYPMVEALFNFFQQNRC